jgi:hypothetical protein
MTDDLALLDFANQQGIARELDAIGYIVGERRRTRDSLRSFAHRIALSIQQQICAAERELADRQELLTRVISLSQYPATVRRENDV